LKTKQILIRFSLQFQTITQEYFASNHIANQNFTIALLLEQQEHQHAEVVEDKI